jgi:CheY-like chemotaxis protein
MDQRMPVMDGVEATRRIRELPDGKAVKLEDLPDGLRSDLIEALETLDNVRIAAIIQQIGKQDQALQKNLSQLADNFDYPAILKLLK